MKRHRGTVNTWFYGKEASEKNCIVYDFNYVTLWKRQN